MGEISYTGKEKIIQRIIEEINRFEDGSVEDVKVNGVSVVDSDGVANIDLSGYTTDDELDNALSEYSKTTEFASVAFSGNYSDLNNPPSIPTKTSDLQNDGDGTSIFTTKSYVDTAIENLPEPMIFKGTLGTGGTITTLPTASSQNEGFTYKVITEGTYASQDAKVGDVFISNGSSWVLIPSGDTDSDTWREIKINGNEFLGNAISTGAVNFKSGTNTTVSGSGHDIQIDAVVPTKTSDLTNDGADGTNVFVADNDSRLTDSRTPKSHTHGSITNGGAITTEVTIASGDKLIISDVSDSTAGKLKRVSVAFDGSTTTKALTQKGTFESFAKPSDIPTVPTKTSDLTNDGEDGTNVFVADNDSRLTDSRAPKSHTHGSITNAGAITGDTTIASGDKLIFADASDSTAGKLKRASVAFDGSTNTKALTQKGTFETFAKPSDIPTVPTKTSDLTNDGADGTNVFVANNDSRLSDSRTPKSHTHGSITNDGAITANTTIENTDRLVFVDANDSNKLKRASVAFDGSTTTKALTQKGTFETFAKADDITSAINDLDGGTIGTPGTGKTLTALSQSNGNINATFGNISISKSQAGLGNVDNTSDATKKTNFTGSIASGNTGFVTGGDIYTALAGKADTSDIPTVNNAKLTIQRNGTTVKTFTANASSNVTADITVPTKTSDLTNDGADGTNVFVADNDSRLTDSRTPKSHTHGSITNGGAITANTALATGDRLVFSDSSDSNKLKRASIAFDDTNDRKALTQNGTFENFFGDGKHYAKNTDPGYDFNNFIDSGVYYFISGSTFTNIPAGGNGILIVYRSPSNASTDTGIFIKQIWMRQGTLVDGTNLSNDYQTFIRTGTGKVSTGITTWSEWHKFVTAIYGTAPRTVEISGTTTTRIGTSTSLENTDLDIIIPLPAGQVELHMSYPIGAITKTDSTAAASGTPTNFHSIRQGYYYASNALGYGEVRLWKNGNNIYAKLIIVYQNNTTNIASDISWKVLYR